jgi:hypothetical protein
VIANDQSTPINPINPDTPIKLESMDDAEICFLTADITAIVKVLAETKENGPNPETITTKRVGRVFGKMRLTEVPRPSGTAPPCAPKPSRARIWQTTKRVIRQWLVSYGMDIPEEFTSAPPHTHQANGVNGGEDDPSSSAAPPLQASNGAGLPSSGAARDGSPGSLAAPTQPPLPYGGNGGEDIQSSTATLAPKEVFDDLPF